jgi:DNA gyrase subunit A
VKKRGGLGVITIRTTERNGKVVAVRVVSDDDHLILITDRGKLIRVPVSNLKILGRATQGVRIMRVDEGEKISAVERLADPEDQGAIEEAPAPAEMSTDEALEEPEEPEAEVESEPEPEPEPEEDE